MHTQEDSCSQNYEVTDSRVNEFFRNIQNDREIEQMSPGIDQSQGQFQTENELQPIIYRTLQLQYNIFLGEEELKFYKTLLLQKQNQIKQLKEKYSKKSSKAVALCQNLKRIDKKIKDTTEGYKRIDEKYQQCKLNQNNQRKERLNCQQKKNQLYQHYCSLQNTHKELVQELQSYQECQDQYEQLKGENEKLGEEIERLEARRREVGEKGAGVRKEQLKAEIRRAYQGIKFAQKEDERISQQYQGKKKHLGALEREQASINHRSMELGSLFNRIASLKEECKQRRWQKLQNEKEYHQLLAQESRMKREFNVASQYSSGQKQVREKMGVVHNFRIIDSEADQELGKLGHQKNSSQHHSQSLQSQEQFDELINRFQKIKGKEKNGS